MFKVLRTGKRKKKEWKRMVTKVGSRAATVDLYGHGRPAADRERWCRHGAALGMARMRSCTSCQTWGSLPDAAKVPSCFVCVLRHRPTRPPPPRQVTFVPPGFTRKPPKYERFIRPTGLRMNKAHVTHPELKATFQLEIIGVKKNPNGQAYTGLGVVTKGERGALPLRGATSAGWVRPAGSRTWAWAISARQHCRVGNGGRHAGCMQGASVWPWPFACSAPGVLLWLGCWVFWQRRSSLPDSRALCCPKLVQVRSLR